MRTQKQREASRANGRKSRGPKTPEGKAISSQNARLDRGAIDRLELLCRDVVLRCERSANFEALFHEFVDHLRPRNPFELALVEDMAAAYWRKRRAHGVETRLLHNVVIARHDPDIVDRISGSFSLLATSPDFQAVSLYQQRHDRFLARALRNLVLARRLAANEPDAPPQASEITNTPSAPFVQNEPDAVVDPSGAGSSSQAPPSARRLSSSVTTESLSPEAPSAPSDEGCPHPPL
jgi:hypothetical protein